MHKRIDNTTTVIHRGCSTSKEQCSVMNDDPKHAFDSITCCTSHNCNQGSTVRPAVFLSTLGLFILLMAIIDH
jgi:hypothetical protein